MLCFSARLLLFHGIFFIGTATSVASNYDFAPTAGVVVVTVIFIALIMLMHFVDFRIKWKFRFRLIPTVLGLLVMCLFVNALQDEDFQTDNYLYPFLFTPAYMTKVNGMAVTFAMDLKFVAVDKLMGIADRRLRNCLTAMPVQMIIQPIMKQINQILQLTVIIQIL